jgi:anti-anti-sigma factor
MIHRVDAVHQSDGPVRAQPSSEYGGPKAERSVPPEVIVTEPQVTTRHASSAVVSVELSGAITVTATCLLREALIDVIMRQRPPRVLIDLRNTTFLDPTAIGALLAAADAADDLRVDLSVCNPNPALAMQLASTGLSHLHAA